MIKSIKFSLSLGQISAVLSALEFVIARIALCCIESFVIGTWACSLHMSGNYSISFRKGKYDQALTVQVLSFLITFWFSISVVFVESKLSLEEHESKRFLNQT